MTPMQSIQRILALATLAATALLSQALHAQVGTHTSHVNVPFAFNCGDQHFAPGTYMVTMTDKNFLGVSNEKQAAWMVFQSDTQSSAPANGYLLFRKYGNRYFLAEYQPSATQYSARIVRSKIERRAARDFAASKADQGRVKLALLENGSAVSSGR